MRQYCLGQDILAQLQECPYDVMVCNLPMPGLDSPAFSTLLRRQHPALCQRVIVLTGDSGSTARRRRRSSQGHHDFCTCLYSRRRATSTSL